MPQLVVHIRKEGAERPEPVVDTGQPNRGPKTFHEALLGKFRNHG
jgi:hypothetical protein